MAKFFVLFLAVGVLIFVQTTTTTTTPKPQKEIVLNVPVLQKTPALPEQPQQFVLLDVPFIVQAPFGQWKDPRQQDACEEAAVLMAISWINNQKIIDKNAALKEIFSMIDYQTKNYGEYRDTSAADTAKRLIAGYFNHQNYFIKENITIKDIWEELSKGNLIIVPANGQKLNNPFFTPPGPERHMIVIRGFDLKTLEFITNDPGISQGEKYRYPQEILFNAIRDYPTGYHVSISKETKIMIVVYP